MSIEKLLDEQTERLILTLELAMVRGPLGSPAAVSARAALRSRIAELIEQARKEDADRLDWLDKLGRFNVGLNPHDGVQLYTLPGVGDGIPVILRLWHKDRGGENQSLRDAIDVVCHD